MRTSRNKEKRAAWRFAMEQIGREFRKAYPPDENLSPELRALAAQLERKIATPRRRKRRGTTENDR